MVEKCSRSGKPYPHQFRYVRKTGFVIFGNIVETTNGGVSATGVIVKMQLSDPGQIVDDCWLQIPDRFSFVKLGNHFVMPNHLHGIIITDKPDDGRGLGRLGRDTINRVSTVTTTTNGAKSQTTPGGVTGINKPMLHDNLSKIIRWFKGRTTFESRKILPDFSWQTRFYDHIIRDEESFNAISNYINNNPRRRQSTKTGNQRKINNH